MASVLGSLPDALHDHRRLCAGHDCVPHKEELSMSTKSIGDERRRGRRRGRPFDRALAFQGDVVG